MKNFLEKYQQDIIGSLSGFDRVRFRGTLRMLSFVQGMFRFLSRAGVLLKNFGEFAEQTTERLREASYQQAYLLGRPKENIPSSKTNKDEKARKIAERDNIEEGLVAVLTCMELCKSYSIFRNKQTKRLELVSRDARCLYIYKYWIDPYFGWMNARLQTWFPFTIHICINGREWLSRRMDEEGMRYERNTNAFLWIEDFGRAQQLMDKIQKTNWAPHLARIARLMNPIHDRIFEAWPMEYYWSGQETEWATDITFQSEEKLGKLFPLLARGALANFSSRNVMRFLGQKIHGNFKGEVISEYKNRPEGICVRHKVDGNAVKMYDKHGKNLRVETTINRPGQFRVFRRAEGDTKGEMKWRKLRKGIADFHRRGNVSQQSNERYLEALASLDTSTPMMDLVGGVCHRTKYMERYVRGFRPWTKEDSALLKAINSGEFKIQGFKNRDLAAMLFPECGKDRKISSRITRKIRMFRAHKIISKVPRRNLYRLTEKGQQIVSALLQVQTISLKQLGEIAA